MGATIQRLIVPDRDGIAEDIVLGYDSPKHYQVLLLLIALPLPGIGSSHIKRRMLLPAFARAGPQSATTPP